MKKQEKEIIINRFKSNVLKAKGIFLIEYKGVNFVELTELRKSLRTKSAELHVAKNTLMKLALKDTPQQSLAQFLDGPNAIIFSYDEGVDVAKVLIEGVKKYPNFKLKSCYFEGQIFDANGIQKLALLPSKKDLRATLVRTIAGPISGLVRVLSGPMRAMVTVLSEINKKKAA
jgi:large subunit ribosomal protein L10